MLLLFFLGKLSRNVARGTRHHSTTQLLKELRVQGRLGFQGLRIFGSRVYGRWGC